MKSTVLTLLCAITFAQGHEIFLQGRTLCTCNPNDRYEICARTNLDGIEIAHERCDKFYKCANSVPVPYCCPDNLVFNIEKGVCDWPGNVDCGNRTLVAEADNECLNNNSNEDNDNEDNETGPCNCDPSEAPEICSAPGSEGVFVAHEYCNHYYVCNHGRPVAMKCAPRLLYNPYKKECDWESAVECGNRTIPEDDGSDNGNDNGSGENGIPGTCNCNPAEAPAICSAPNSEGTLVAHQNCSQFYICNHGRPFPMSCGTNLLYNPYIEQCDFAKNVDCGDRYDPFCSSCNSSSENSESNESNGDNGASGGGGNPDEDCDSSDNGAGGDGGDSGSGGPGGDGGDTGSGGAGGDGGDGGSGGPGGDGGDTGSGGAGGDGGDSGSGGAGGDGSDGGSGGPGGDGGDTGSGGAGGDGGDSGSGGPGGDGGDTGSGGAGGDGGDTGSGGAGGDGGDSGSGGAGGDGGDSGSGGAGGDGGDSGSGGAGGDGGDSGSGGAGGDGGDSGSGGAGGDGGDSGSGGSGGDGGDGGSGGGSGDNGGDGDEDCDNGDNGGGENECNCDPNEAATICSAPGSDDTLVAHANCNQFYKCANGVPVAFTCPGILLYNPYIQECDWPSAVDCGDRVIPDSDKDDSEECEGDDNDNNNESDEGPDNGTGSGQCNCDPSEAPAICAAGESDGVLVAHENCNQFYKCANGVPVALICPPELLYNPYTQQCDYASNVECGDRVIPDNNGEGDNNNVPEDSAESSESNESNNCGHGDPSLAPEICAAPDSNGVLVAHEHCDKFYMCSNGIPITLTCPPDLLFNPATGICDWDVDCGDRVVPESNDNDNGCPCNYREAPAICSKPGSDGIHVAHENCNQFYVCSHGKTVAHTCAPTLFYNPQNKICDWPAFVNCGERAITNFSSFNKHLIPRHRKQLL